MSMRSKTRRDSHRRMFITKIMRTCSWLYNVRFLSASQSINQLSKAFLKRRRMSQAN